MCARPTRKREATIENGRNGAQRAKTAKDQIVKPAKRSKASRHANEGDGAHCSRRCWVGIDGTRQGWCIALITDEYNDVKNAETSPYKIRLFVCATLAALRRVLCNIQAREDLHVESIGIDMPIGLPEHAERGGRGCDRLARQILAEAKARALKSGTAATTSSLVGPSSIFTPPSRPALEAFARGATHAEVTAANRLSAVPVTGKDAEGAGLGLSIQSYNIMGKILELDREISSDVATPTRTTAGMALSQAQCVPAFECHPELAFLALKAGQAHKSTAEAGIFDSVSALQSKRTANGRDQRIRLLREKFGPNSQLLRLDLESAPHVEALQHIEWKELLARSSLSLPFVACETDAKTMAATRVSVAVDDILDALICATSAMRLSGGPMHVLGNQQQRDTRGLPMVITL